MGHRLSFAFAGLCVGLAGCASASANPSADTSQAAQAMQGSSIPNASDFNQIVASTRPFSSPLEIAQSISRFAPQADEGAAEFDMVSRRDASAQNRMVMLFSVSGHADDSVKGTQWRIVYEPVDGGWRVIEAGERYACYRGENAGKWQKEPCP